MIICASPMCQTTAGCLCGFAGLPERFQGFAGKKENAPDPLATLSSWMISQGYATGHGDTIEDLLGELAGQINDERYKPKTEEVKAAWWKEESGRIFNKLCKAQDEIGRLRDENAAFAEQLSLRDQRDFDMQEIMRVNNALLADIARKGEALRDALFCLELTEKERDNPTWDRRASPARAIGKVRAALQPSDSIGKSVESFEKEAWALHLACIKALGVLGSQNDKIAILERHDLVSTEETVTALRSALHLHREACKRALSDKGGES